MTDERIEKIKSAVESAENIPANKKAELLRLLSTLQPAIARVSQTHHEDAESIARLVEVSAHATKASASGVKISEKAGVISPKTSTPEGRGLRLVLAMVEGVVIKIETLPQFVAAGTFARVAAAPLRCCIVAVVADRGRSWATFLHTNDGGRTVRRFLFPNIIPRASQA
jgi:hypothetical protein